MAKWLSVTGKAVQDSQASTSNQLVVPPNAKKNKKDPNDSFWHERVQIVKAGSTTATNNDGHEVTKAELRWRVTESGGSGLNNGREFSDFWSINWSIYPDGDRTVGWYGVSQRNFGRIQAILRAAGINPDLPDGGYSESLLASCFPDDGLNTPLINKEIDVELRQKMDDYLQDLATHVQRIIPNTKARSTSTVKPAGVVTV